MKKLCLVDRAIHVVDLMFLGEVSILTELQEARMILVGKSNQKYQFDIYSASDLSNITISKSPLLEIVLRSSRMSRKWIPICYWFQIVFILGI